MPFLPGDALIFAIGMIAANNQINFSVIIPLLMIAAILGDNVNYFVGKRFGNYILNNDSKFFIKEKHLNKAKEFFERNGKQSIIISRFVPVVRTIVPFLCGTTGVPYRTFLLFSLFGAFMWVGLIGTIGYFLGTFEGGEQKLEKKTKKNDSFYKKELMKSYMLSNKAVAIVLHSLGKFCIS